MTGLGRYFVRSERPGRMIVSAAYEAYRMFLCARAKSELP